MRETDPFACIYYVPVRQSVDAGSMLVIPLEQATPELLAKIQAYQEEITGEPVVLYEMGRELCEAPKVTSENNNNCVAD